MKSYGNIFAGIVGHDNLAQALKRAAKGKQERPGVKGFLEQSEKELDRLRRELVDGSYRPGPFRQFHICDPKPRLIRCADFRDRIVHHAVCMRIAPLIERSLIFHNYACRQTKGSHRAVLAARANSRRFAYWLRTDILHYYENIDHDILLDQLFRLFREAKLKELLRMIVDHSPVGVRPGKGLPIGSLTSQWFANLYLNSIDHWILQKMIPKAYLRYMDDFALWSDSKDHLFAIAAELQYRLTTTLHLEQKRKATLVAPSSEGMPFLGYRIYPGMVRERAARVRRRQTLLCRREQQFLRGDISEMQLQASVRSMAGPRWFFGFGAPINDQGRRSRGSHRVNRGGSWRNDHASYFRGANRNRNDPGNRNDNLGFRLVSTTLDQDHKPSNPPIPVFRHVGTETPLPDAASHSVSAGPTPHPGIFIKIATGANHAMD